MVVALAIGWSMVASPVHLRRAAAADGSLCATSVEGADHDLVVGVPTVQTAGSWMFERQLA